MKVEITQLPNTKLNRGHNHILKFQENLTEYDGQSGNKLGITLVFELNGKMKLIYNLAAFDNQKRKIPCKKQNDNLYISPNTSYILFNYDYDLSDLIEEFIKKNEFSV